MEIERKFLIRKLPENLESYPFRRIEQAYLCTDPVVRIRRQDQDYILTYKGRGMLAREEYNLPLNEQAYLHLKEKADGNVIEKTRYLIPLSNGLTAELDLFCGCFSGMILAEVEFPDLKTADAFCPPDWFGEDVTMNPDYHNSSLSRRVF